MIRALMWVYLACFTFAAAPGIVRVIRRGSSADLSVWREWLVLTGIVLQFVVFWQSGASWRVWISPVTSGLSLLILLGVVYRHR